MQISCFIDFNCHGFQATLEQADALDLSSSYFSFPVPVLWSSTYYCSQVLAEVWCALTNPILKEKSAGIVRVPSYMMRPSELWLLMFNLSYSLWFATSKVMHPVKYWYNWFAYSCILHLLLLFLLATVFVKQRLGCWLCWGRWERWMYVSKLVRTPNKLLCLTMFNLIKISLHKTKLYQCSFKILKCIKYKL